MVPDNTFSAENHYVPVWYQRRFLMAGTPAMDFACLDKAAEEPVITATGHRYVRRAVKRKGPQRCFKERHLYTTYFRGEVSDAIERHFFGAIDRAAPRAVEAFSDFSVRDETIELQPVLLRHMSSQKLRTPKGLAWLRKHVPGLTAATVAPAMTQISDLYGTIWAEGVWEILHCDESPTKFILSDHPVVTYNKDLFPGCPECQYPGDAGIAHIGTHTIFPLDLNRCLVITNLQYVRDSDAKRTRLRTNPRVFAQTMMYLLDVQYGREIPEEWVVAINYIMKTRAARFVAAPIEDWLFPERAMRSRAWNKLGGKFFLMPDPRMVSFSEGILVGFKDGSAWGQDEYGRRTGDDASAKLQRAKEWVSYQKSVAAWDAKFGRLPAEKLRRHFVPMAGPKRARASGGATQVVEQPRKQVQNGPPAPEAVASMLDNPT